jgi:hypothetical protein
MDKEHDLDEELTMPEADWHEPVADEVAAAPVEEPVVEDVVVEVIPEPTPVPVYEAPVATASAVVGDGDTDPVSVAACVYKNPYARKSLSVHHLQRRLNELGYPEAYADLDGWYGDLTKNAVAKFQEAKGLEATGLIDLNTLELVFQGDPNVHVVA